jgi:hypothetical protein
VSPLSQDGGSKLRLSVSPANRRLLKGYGPLAVLLFAFVLVAVLAPTIAPTQVVEKVAHTVTVNSGGGTGTTSSGTTSSGTTSAGAATGGTSSGSSASKGSGVVASSAPKGATAPCPGGRTEQVTGDPYSPPCIAFSGNNGGATSPGVTATSINVTYRVTTDGTSFQNTLAQLGGAQFYDTEADIERTVSVLAQYFNKNFQFYGRKLNIEFFTGQGSQLSELLGEGQAQATADAVTAAQQYHAFAEINGVTEPYDVALAQQHVVSFGAPYLSAQFMAQYAPYMWSVATEGNDVVQTTSEFYCKSLGGGDAQWAGGSLQGQPRKTAIIAPANPWYQSSVTSAISIDSQCGHPITDNIQYQLDLATESSQAATIIAKLQNDGITTIVCGCDPVFPVYLTGRAEEQNYQPEWVVAGVAATDTDIVGQLFDQAEWSHAFGISYSGPTVPKEATLGYAAYKSIDPTTEPANEVSLIYEQMYEMAIGLQMAGPDLTPQNLEAGFRAYPGSVDGAPNAEFGTWGFPPGHFTPQLDSWIIYWEPTRISPYNGKAGSYVIASPRYKAGQYPTGPPPLPAGFGTSS